MEDPRIISALFIFLKMAYYNVLINKKEKKEQTQGIRSSVRNIYENIIIRKFVYRILRRRWESVKAIYPGYLKKKRERVFRNIVCTCGLKEQKTCSNIPKHL